MRRRNRRGFTLIELLVVVAIIAILAAILFPVFARAKQQGRISACCANLKQLGQAFHLYALDFNGFLPIGTDDIFGRRNGIIGEFCHWGGRYGTWIWDTGIRHYVTEKEVWHCPADYGAVIGDWMMRPTMFDAIGGSYEYNIYMLWDHRNGDYNPDGLNCLDLLPIDYPADTSMIPLLHDARDTWHETESAWDPYKREARDTHWNVCFLDGSVRHMIAYQMRVPGRYPPGARWTDTHENWWWRGGLRGSPRDPKNER